jgi:spermidine synthase
VFSFALLLSFLSGFISLSQEIILVALFSYHVGGRAYSFAYVLGFFLIGIALGTYLMPRLLKRLSLSVFAGIGALLMLSGAVFLISLWASSTAFAIRPALGTAFFFLSIVSISFFSGSIFPLLPRLNNPNEKPRISHLYAANIFGSTLGPLVTGFVLLDAFTMQVNILALGSLSIACGALIIARSDAHAKKKLVWGLIALTLTTAAWTCRQNLYGRLFENLIQDETFAHKNFLRSSQSRSGIIHIEQSYEGDILYGGGVYDGRYSIDPVQDSNLIQRAYLIAALHAQPRQVLEIGLGSGSWTRVLTLMPWLEKLTVIEINPAYVSLLKNYPAENEILNDPRVTIHIDDGRRWLRRHPGEKLDFIVMNTSFHWRNNQTNLLSINFFNEVKNHLNPGGVFYFNTTSSDDAAFTAAHAFKHAVRVRNFIAVSDEPFALSSEQRLIRLSGFQINGQKMFDASDKHQTFFLKNMLGLISDDVADDLRARNDLRLITDDNMLTEFKLKRP